MTHQVRWLGHAATEVVTDSGTRILTDPWITGNPSCPVDVYEVETPDVILLTHDHFDHLGEDIPCMVEGTETTIVAQPEVISKLGEMGVSEANCIFGMGMNVGGTVKVKGVEVTMVQAFHSAECGTPAGFIVRTADGQTIYHAGDTGAFPGMEMLGELYDIDLALLPIGSVFVMDPEQAAWALTKLQPETVIPIHYGTFPILVQDADKFVQLAADKAPDVEVKVPQPGEVVVL